MKNSKREIISEIMMGSPVTLKPDDTLDLANDIISLGRIRHIPIVDDGKLIGIISDRDLIGAAASRIFWTQAQNQIGAAKKRPDQRHHEKTRGHHGAGHADQRRGAPDGG
jgi:signal-transduction protein with cAMP-binding, CBS, and nucleotidyltransferase domain